MNDKEEKCIPLLEKVIECLMREGILDISLNTKVEESLISLSNEIRAKMGSDQSLFMQYEELCTLNENALLQDTYRRGFMDGIALFREMSSRV